MGSRKVRRANIGPLLTQITSLSIAKVDKYGRKVSKTRDSENLRRFYRLEGDEEEEAGTAAPDYARGEGLLESSDEDAGDDSAQSENDDENGAITLGRDVQKPSRRRSKSPHSDAEIDLDETQFEDLDREASAYSSKFADAETDTRPTGKETARIAVVNLDWDHVRASHLFKIFDSVVSQGASGSVRRGQVLSVRVYPSEFGKERMAREEKEGPPPEVFLKKGQVADEDMDEEDVNEQTIFQQGDEKAQYDDDALRKYQLERLRSVSSFVSLSEYISFQAVSPDTTTQLFLSILRRPLHMLTRNSMVLSWNDQRICLTSAMCPMEWNLAVNFGLSHAVSCDILW